MCIIDIILLLMTEGVQVRLSGLATQSVPWHLVAGSSIILCYTYIHNYIPTHINNIIP